MALQAWTGRTSGQIDADSPVDIALIGGFDDDITHLRQTVYGNGSGGFLTPIDGHNHDGANSAFVSVGRSATSTSQNISPTSVWYPDTSIGVFLAGADISFQAFLNSAWQNVEGLNAKGQTIFGDGVSGLIRFNNGTVRLDTVYYLNLDDMD